MLWVLVFFGSLSSSTVHYAVTEWLGELFYTYILTGKMGNNANSSYFVKRLSINLPSIDTDT